MNNKYFTQKDNYKSFQPVTAPSILDYATGKAELTDEFLKSPIIPIPNFTQSGDIFTQSQDYNDTKKLNNNRYYR